MRRPTIRQGRRADIHLACAVLDRASAMMTVADVGRGRWTTESDLHARRESIGVAVVFDGGIRHALARADGGGRVLENMSNG